MVVERSQTAEGNASHRRLVVRDKREERCTGESRYHASLKRHRLSPCTVFTRSYYSLKDLYKTHHDRADTQNQNAVYQHLIGLE